MACCEGVGGPLSCGFSKKDEMNKLALALCVSLFFLKAFFTLE